MRRTSGILGLVACAMLVLACDSSTDAKITYGATMSGAKEVPQVTSSGTGTFAATLDPATNVLTYSFNWSGLNGNTTLSHIHGPATTAVSAGVLINFDAPNAGRTITLGAPSGTASGTVDLSLVTANVNVSGDSVHKLLDLGLLYVNIHSSVNGGGEIRGQIVRQ